MKSAPVKGFEDRYMVWENGTITTTKRTVISHGKEVTTEKIRGLKPSVDRKGYLVVNLYDGSGNRPKSMKVHRLVAEAFIPNPEDKRCVCHKDNNPKNNDVSNLYWGTDQENQDQAWEDGRHHSESPVKMIRSDGTEILYKSQAEASRETGIWQQNISKCLDGTRKSAGGYQWQRLV